jgi:hypothetical protein
MVGIRVGRGFLPYRSHQLFQDEEKDKSTLQIATGPLAVGVVEQGSYVGWGVWELFSPQQAKKNRF